MMKNFAVAAVFACFALAAGAAEMTGYVSDSKCAAKHASDSAQNAKCIEMCIKNGASAVFVDTAGDKVYKISNPDKVQGHYGHKVIVTGDVKEDTLTIDSVKMAKSSGDKKQKGHEGHTM